MKKNKLQPHSNNCNAIKFLSEPCNCGADEKNRKIIHFKPDHPISKAILKGHNPRKG